MLYRLDPTVAYTVTQWLCILSNNCSISTEIIAHIAGNRRKQIKLITYSSLGKSE